jgi:integrase
VKRAHKVRPASLQELEAIVEALPERYKLMALLAAWCAMRFGELAELRRGDIDLRTDRVSITRDACRVDGSARALDPGRRNAVPTR